LQLKNKIIFTVTNDLNFDQRMQRICSTLSNAGYEVELVGRILREDRYEAKIDSAISQLPSYTQLGMASLLPNSNIEFCQDETGRVHLKDNALVYSESKPIFLLIV
jgi:hypothetical protein